MYITAPPVNYSILCLSSIVHIVAFVNLLLKKMVVWTDNNTPIQLNQLELKWRPTVPYGHDTT